MCPCCRTCGMIMVQGVPGLPARSEPQSTACSSTLQISSYSQMQHAMCMPFMMHASRVDALAASPMPCKSQVGTNTDGTFVAMLAVQLHPHSSWAAAALMTQALQTAPSGGAADSRYNAGFQGRQDGELKFANCSCDVCAAHPQAETGPWRTKSLPAGRAPADQKGHAALSSSP